MATKKPNIEKILQTIEDEIINSEQVILKKWAKKLHISLEMLNIAYAKFEYDKMKKDDEFQEFIGEKPSKDNYKS